MPSFDSDGFEIFYEDLGEGPPIVLIHGFAASFDRNWRGALWVDALTGAGRRVIGLDCRGHGKSAKSRDPGDYGDDRMALDMLRLMDHLAIGRADLMGYSLGGMIAAWLAATHPERFGALVIGGVGDRPGGSARRASAIARALEPESDSATASPTARAFRDFASAGDNDLRALAAVMRARPVRLDGQTLGRIRAPVLIVVGGDDPLARDPEALAAKIPGARLRVIPGRDHVRAVGDRRFREAVLAFLAEHPLAG